MMSFNGDYCMSVDFGTTNTLVFSRADGVVVNQASLVALRSHDDKKQTVSVLGAGSAVSALVGRTAPDISVEAPLAAGVIRDTGLAKVLLQSLMSSHLPWTRHIPVPHKRRGILISAPREVTEYERFAFHEAAQSLGFAKVGIVDEPLSAALGSGLPVFEPAGQMLVDLGSGITEAVVLSSGMVVESGSFRQGGNDLDQDIVAYIEEVHRFKIALGLAKEIKERFGAVGRLRQGQDILLYGKCIETKLPRKKRIDSAELTPPINSYVNRIEKLILDVLEKANPELVSDILEAGVWLSGGGALLTGLTEELERRLQFKVHRVQDPLSAVINGNGKIVVDPGFNSLCRNALG